MKTKTKPRVDLIVVRDDDDDLIVVWDGMPRLKCACIHQAAAGAVRGDLAKAMIATVRDRHGDVIPRGEWPRCRVPRGEWEDRVHRWTHEARLVMA